MRRSHVMLVSVCFTVVIACGGSTSQQPDQPVNDGTIPRQVAVTEVTNQSVTLRWDAVEDAEAYYLYYASEPISDIENIHAYQNGDWLADVNSPYTVTGLTNNITYYFLITAVVDGEESSPGYSVNATPVDAPPTPQPSAEEVRVIELINRARRDPVAEVDRHPQVNDLNNGLEPDTIVATQKEPLAFNPHLMVAAREHSEWMLETNTFSHTGANGSSPQQRIAQTEYGTPDASGENITVTGRTNLDTIQVIETHHAHLFASPSHRTTMFAEAFKEVGIGRELGDYTFEEGTLTSSMLTQKYARQRDRHFITGVIFTDDNGNDIYDVGEGMENVVITVNGTAHRAYQSGIYAVQVPGNAIHQVTISGGTLPEPVDTEVEVMNRNVKLDVILDGNDVRLDSW
ncbi:CAP domain-containing protein [Marinimicrobium sp. ABcell2]|uniref:CAP domain-containing protein n=1 Tax=Marinimicrobium sp. ABcell2 TaxID=3069751 RepID=UPI0027B6062B|nr:CAP domain-containing protein [Marinimicrobium sp. ABcell2]MDQ2077878.1 CAP domain-containing protein [Marinimicrobium sp. ABcell2]